MPSSRINIPESLEECYRTATPLKYDVSELNLIIFSDHHRGTGDRADDYRFCSATYETALAHYWKSGATLVLLGDVEELWENSIKDVLYFYRDITAKEAEFDQDCRYLRIYGNHDSDWRSEKMAFKYLKINRPVHESVKVEVFDGEKFMGNIYLVHGHQGSFFSDTMARLSKFFVRYFWRHFQRIFNQPLTTAATSTRMRNKHDKFYYDWARSHEDKLVVITGHSHEPVFNGLTYADRLEADHRHLTRKEDNGTLSPEEVKRLEEVRNRIAALKKHDSTHLNPSGQALPCYYNTGCCSFADGEITGIEIMDRSIRLIKWTASGEREVIQEENIRRIMSMRTIRTPD